MSFTFRVVFDGVLAYVPDKPFFVKCDDKSKCCGKYTDREGKEKNICYECVKEEGCWERRSDEEKKGKPQSGPIRSLAVLLPDLRRPGTPRVPASGLNFPTFREPHFPLLKFGLGDLREGTTRRVDLVCRDISRKDEEGLLFLRREQIRFNLDAENATTFSFAGWAPCPLDPYKLPECCREFGKTPEWWGKEPDLGDRDQLESLWWLPDLARIVNGNEYEGADKVKPEVLPSYRGPFPQDLIARVECLGGRLRTFDFNRGVDGFPLRWRFAPPGGDPKGVGSWNRALANSLALEFFDVRSEVHIELRRLANEVVIEDLVLAPGPGADRSLLEISISNREPDLLFQEESFSRSTLPDLDFQPFYENLSQFKGDIAKLPIPYPAKDSFFGVVEKPCSGSGMGG